MSDQNTVSTATDPFPLLSNEQLSIEIFRRGARVVYATAHLRHTDPDIIAEAATVVALCEARRERLRHLPAGERLDAISTFMDAAYAERRAQVTGSLEYGAADLLVEAGYDELRAFNEQAGSTPRAAARQTPEHRRSEIVALPARPEARK